MRKAQGTKISASLREMAAVGIPVDFPVAELEAEIEVEIEQVGAVCDTLVFDLADRRAGYMIDLVIINQTSRPIPFRDVELRPPWPNSEIQWLPDPRDMGRNPGIYCFPGKGAPELPRDVVMNHSLLRRRTLRPGCPVHGFLLGIGNPKPEKLLLGVPVEVTLAIIGFDNCEYAEKIDLSVDPLWKWQQEPSRKVSTGGLFGSRRAQNLGSPDVGNIGKVRVASLRR